MKCVFFTPHLVCKYIKYLKGNGAAGPDSLPPILYKQCVHSVSYPLSVVFNYSLQSGMLPEIWQTAVINPVFKKGSPVMYKTTDLYH